MKLGIMQPYFFPYLGYYELIALTDSWVVFDTVKYKPKSWMNRNRVLSPAGGWQYISVPVQRHHGVGAICDVCVIDAGKAFDRIKGQLQHYRAVRAPYFSAVMNVVAETFEGLPDDHLSTLNIRSLASVCKYLGLSFDPLALSTAGLPLPQIAHPGEWALEISSVLGATEYINPPNGRELFERDAFAERGIRLTFTDLIDYRYDCRPYTYVECLSIVDVLMWNSPDAVTAYLHRQRAT